MRRNPKVLALALILFAFCLGMAAWNALEARRLHAEADSLD